jgi:hypothetical protein
VFIAIVPRISNGNFLVYSTLKIYGLQFSHQQKKNPLSISRKEIYVMSLMNSTQMKSYTDIKQMGFAGMTQRVDLFRKHNSGGLETIEFTTL